MSYMDKCTYVEQVEPHGYIFTGKCIVTQKEVSVFVPGAELYAYNQGKPIQLAMPSVKPGDREFLMTGISDEGWKKTFSEES